MQSNSMTQYYRIADLTVAMNSFGRTVEQAKPYLIDDVGEVVPEIKIVSNSRSLKERQPHLTEDDAEYISTGGFFYRELVKYGGMMLHSSAVVMDGRAYLFSAPSGTGKSTHTKLWMNTFGTDRAQILNDDKPAIRCVNGVWYAYGTPWSGKYDININMRVPLAGICMLERGTENKIAPFNGPAAIQALLEQTARLRTPEFMSDMLEILDSLMTDVPIWKLQCNMEPEAAILSHKVMSEAAK